MSAVSYSVADGIAHLELNRPEAANTIDMALAVALGEAAERAAQDDAVRAVLLTGAGARFCGGGDISTFADAPDPAAFVAELATTADAAVHALEDLAKPVVAAVHGAVAGGGLGIMLAADVVIAAEGTKFVFAYPSIGLSPDCGTSVSLPAAMGRHRALAFALCGRALGADEAREQGLVAEVVADPRARAHQLATAWVGGASAAHGAARRLLRASGGRGRDASAADEIATIRERAGSREARELFGAFLGR